MAVDVSRIPNNNKFDPVREAILDLQTQLEEEGQIAYDGTLTLSEGTAVTLTGGSTFTANQSGDTTITIGVDLSITTNAASGGGSLSYLDGEFTYTPPDLSGFIELTDLSITTSSTPSGGGALSYDDTTGVFTFTPADAGTGLTLQQVTANGNTTNYGISTGNITVQPSGTGSGVVTIQANSIGDARLDLTAGTGGTGVIKTTNDVAITFEPNATEKVVIASDGNMNVYEKLAVGKTTAASTYHLEVDGTALANNFITSMTASGTTYTGTVSQYYNALQIRTGTGGTISIGGSGPMSVQNNVAIKDGDLDVNGDVTADFFIGDGSQLTNIAGTSSDLQDVTDNGATTDNSISIIQANVGVPTANGVYTSFLVESTDTHLDLISSAAGSWGTAINLVEGSSSTANANVWSIARRTTTGNGGLYFNYGTNNEHTNTTQVIFSTTGNIIASGTISGNGSGLTNVDADTVDGLQASQFLRSDAADTATGTITFENGIRVGTGDLGTSANRASIVFGEGTPTSDSMYIEYDGEGLSGANNSLFIGRTDTASDIARFTYGGDIEFTSNNWSATSAGTITGVSLVGSSVTVNGEMHADSIDIHPNNLAGNARIRSLMSGGNAGLEFSDSADNASSGDQYFLLGANDVATGKLEVRFKSSAFTTGWDSEGTLLAEFKGDDSSVNFPQGKVGIGTTDYGTTAAKLLVGGYINNGSSAVAQFDGFVRLEENLFIHDPLDNTKAGRLTYDGTNGLYFIGENGAANFGIGVTTPTKTLDVNGPIRTRNSFNLSDGTTQIGGLFPYKVITGSGTDNSTALFAETGLGLHFMTNGSVSSKMVIESGGNVLVGKTSSSYGTQGVEIRPSEVLITKDGGTALSLNRLSSDGTILSLAQGTSTVANFNTSGSGLVLDMVEGGNSFTFYGSGAIGMQEDHYINLRFDIADNANNVQYILLCVNAGGNDVNGTIRMDRTSGLRHACNVDIIITAGASLAPVGGLRAHGVAGSGEPEYRLVSCVYNAVTYIALEISNPDLYYESSGAYFTGRITSSGQKLLPVLPSQVSSVANFESNSEHSVQGNFVVKDGRLGVGVGNPLAPLDVVGNAYVRSGNLYTDNILPYSGNPLYLLNGGNNYAVVNGRLSVGTTTTTTSAKLIVGGAVSSSSSAIAQIDGFIRVGGAVIIHDQDNISNEAVLTCTASQELTLTGTFKSTADVVAYSSSDKRFKDNITPIANAIDKVNAIGGYEFDWNDNQETYEGHDVGVIAQEVEEVLPEVVTTREDGYKAVKYEKMVPLLIEAIKEQQKQIDELKARLDA